MRMPATSGRSTSRQSGASGSRCGNESERSRGRPGRRSGAAAAFEGAQCRGDRLPRDPAADRRPDRDEAGHQRRRDRSEPGRRAGPGGDRRGRGGKPPLPLKASGPADGDRQPDHRAAWRRDDRDQRGLPLCAGPARQSSAASRDPRSLPRSPGTGARGGEARADGGHLPARGRSSRRHAVRGPRRSADVRDVGPVRPPPARGVRAAGGEADRRARIVSADESQALWCELAWLGGERAEEGVLIELDGERFESVTPRVASAPPGATSLAGLTIPGLANAHSHAFQRAIRGRTQAERGDFWTWRQRMYAVAEAIEPDQYFALARATFAEMALAGITAVGEFHYLHHGPGGARYDDPNAIGKALIDAAGEAGIRITLLDTCYLHGGIGREPEGAQLRFSDADAEG